MRVAKLMFFFAIWTIPLLQSHNDRRYTDSFLVSICSLLQSQIFTFAAYIHSAHHIASSNSNSIFSSYQSQAQ
ncbi:uncharacterized protein V1516DRAFT_678239 [Lipomyces oligophaga]|uniref:uncharacterized protein n=1 Tax=Lipomyces oligophaga TaxID=45792 RepID=UPI0034CD3FC6